MENISSEFVYFSYKNVLECLGLLISSTMIISVNERVVLSSPLQFSSYSIEFLIKFISADRFFNILLITLGF